MGEYRGADGRTYVINPPSGEPEIGARHDLNGYRFVETLHGPMGWGTCVGCGKPSLQVVPTGRVGAGGLEEDTGGAAQARCDGCGRRHHDARLDYYETGRDVLYVTVDVDPARLDPAYDRRGRTSCEQFFATGAVLAANTLAERTGVAARWVQCVECELPIDPAGRTVEHPDRHMSCVRYPADAPTETPLYPLPRQES